MSQGRKFRFLPFPRNFCYSAQFCWHSDFTSVCDVCFPLQTTHSARRFPMYKAFPGSEYYQRVRLLLAHLQSFRFSPFSSEYLSPQDVNRSPKFLTFPFRACRAHRPRRRLPALAYLEQFVVVFQRLNTVDHRFIGLTRLTLLHFRYGPHSLCLRLTYTVTSIGPRLDSTCCGCTAFVGGNCTL